MLQQTQGLLAIVGIDYGAELCILLIPRLCGLGMYHLVTLLTRLDKIIASRSAAPLCPPRAISTTVNGELGLVKRNRDFAKMKF